MTSQSQPSVGLHGADPMVRDTLEEERLTRERALAAELFPREWAAALLVTGKRGSGLRKRLRQLAVETAKQRELRVIGAECANCDSFMRNPGMMRGTYCEADSDFYGYAITKPHDLCSRWLPAAPVTSGEAVAARLTPGGTPSIPKGQDQ